MLLTACSPICEAVDSWTWGTCYADIHGNGPSAIVSAIDTPAATEYADIVNEARPIVRAMLVNDNLPGVSLAIAVAGEIVWAEGFGWADIDARRPVTPQTGFRIDEVAQAMTSTAVGILLDRDRIDIDRSARDYVPGFPAKQWPFTTRQLMGHIAGISHYGDDEEMLYRSTACTSPLEAVEIYGSNPFPENRPATVWVGPCSRFD